MPYSEIIRKIMSDHGLNQTEMAKSLGISQPNVYKLINGITKYPNAGILITLHRKFKVNPRVLIGADYKSFYLI